MGIDVVTSREVEASTLGRIGRALADPSRQRLLLELLDGARYPSDLAAETGLSRTNVSNHLTCLRECGIIVPTAQGRRIRYEISSPGLVDALRSLTAVDLVPLSDCCAEPGR